MEVCDRIRARDNGITVCWVPAHSGAQGNKIADQYAKAAAARSAPCSDGVTDEHLRETSLSHITRTAT